MDSQTPTNPQPYTPLERWRMDGALLLGAASHLIGKLATDAGADPVIRDMAVTWTASYARYSSDQRAALPWSDDFWWTR